jgi:hypothetical protein
MDVKTHEGDIMGLCFKIEVRSNVCEQWIFFEELEKSPEVVRDYVRLIRTAYPNYWVRALDKRTGEIITTN